MLIMGLMAGAYFVSTLGLHDLMMVELVKEWGGAPQAARHRPALTPGHIPEAVPYLVHNAELHLRARKHRLNGFGQSFEPIDTGDEAVLDTPGFQFIKERQPELGALALAKPQSQELLLTVQGDA